MSDPQAERTEELRRAAAIVHREDNGSGSFCEDDVAMCWYLSSVHGIELTLEDAGVVRELWKALQAQEHDGYAVMEQDLQQIADPQERARCLFTQWHVDEVTDGAKAAEYADRLLLRLRAAGLTISLMEQPHG